MSEEEVKTIFNKMLRKLSLNEKRVLCTIKVAHNKEIERLNKELNKYRYTPKAHFKETMELRKENARLNNIINESAEEILKELEENNHLSYGVALAIRQKLLDKVEENK